MRGMTLTKNSQRQFSQSVRCPPSVGPMVGASETIRPMIAPEVARLSGGKAVKAIANTVGIIAPPMKPCRPRVMIIVSIDDDMPVSTLMIVKPAHEIMNSFCVPHRREKDTPGGMLTTSG